MNAIVCLTRGYPSAVSYDRLIARNLAIKKHINKDGEMKLILFHEGNISENHMSYISLHSGQVIEFVDVSKVFSGGYEGMCRFYICQMWEYLREYEIIMRIDEDCILSEVLSNPFEQMNGNVFLKSVYWAESHSETNATLPDAIHKLTGAAIHEFYNHKFPYTNVCLVRSAFFLTNPVHEVINSLGNSDEQRLNRWGDLPLLGSILNIYAKNKVGTIEGLKYKHISHNVEVTCQ